MEKFNAVTFLIYSMSAEQAEETIALLKLRYKLGVEDTRAHVSAMGSVEYEAAMEDLNKIKSLCLRLIKYRFDLY